MHKFRSLTPNSRARRRREEEAAAEQAAMPKSDTSATRPQIDYRPQPVHRPASSQSARSRSRVSIIRAQETESESQAMPAPANDRRQNNYPQNNYPSLAERQQVRNNSFGPMSPSRGPLSPSQRIGPMSPSSNKNVAFFDQIDHNDTRPTTPETTGFRSSNKGSDESYETDATSVNTLPALQHKGHGYEYSVLEPVLEDDPASYDLVEPATTETQRQNVYSLETRAEQIFSRDHLQAIFDDPRLLRQFTSFLGQHRPTSLPLLIYYLDALKALAAVRYSNAVAEALEPLESHEWSSHTVPPTQNSTLESKAKQAFDVLVREDLPAFVTFTWVAVASQSIRRRISGTMPPHMREQSEGLAEVFCLTDPSRSDNPIVFSSEEFHRTTQYGVNYVIGRNCRFLQGPRTNRDAVRRLREYTRAGKEVCEAFVNYRRDGSPFMNLLMTAPLRDSRGNLRYFIGAQVDVSNLVKECSGLEGAQRVVAKKAAPGHEQQRDEFQALTEMFNAAELDIVRKSGGALHQVRVEEDDDASSVNTWSRPRLLLKEGSNEGPIKEEYTNVDSGVRAHGKLIGVYQNYLLVRPYPSLRILFASPSLRVPGMLQSPFMNRIGSSERVREELVAALAEGRGVTAKIRWVSKNEDEGRNRWIHCTPLYGSSGQIGVWMIVIVDDDSSKNVRRFREAPPVSSAIGGRSQSVRPQGGRSGSSFQGRQQSVNGRQSNSNYTIEEERLEARLPQGHGHGRSDTMTNGHGRTATMTSRHDQQYNQQDEFDFRV